MAGTRGRVGEWGLQSAELEARHRLVDHALCKQPERLLVEAVVVVVDAAQYLVLRLLVVFAVDVGEDFVDLLHGIVHPRNGGECPGGLLPHLDLPCLHGLLVGLKLCHSAPPSPMTVAGSASAWLGLVQSDMRSKSILRPASVTTV